MKYAPGTVLVQHACVACGREWVEDAEESCECAAATTRSYLDPQDFDDAFREAMFS